MTTTLTSRAPRRNRVRVALTIGLTATALFGVAACSKQEASTPTASSAPTTSAAPSTTAPAGGASTTAAPATTTTSSAPKEIGNSDVKKALEASDPELWALVNYDIMSWDAFNGFNIPLKPGADATKAVALCEAISKVVYQGNAETPIAIATGASVDDITGTPVVKRANKAGACAPV
jgi:hypothetical protein